MIRILDFHNLLTAMTVDIKSGIEELQDFVLVANEKHLVKRLGDKDAFGLA